MLKREGTELWPFKPKKKDDFLANKRLTFRSSGAIV